MSQWDPSGSMSSSGASRPSGEVREPGARRRKLAGYLKAANELRQSYQQQYTSQWSQQSAGLDDEQGIPGAFPDVAVVRSGDEEMVLFPSYARRHVKRKLEETRRQGFGSEAVVNIGDSNYAQREWERHEDDTAIVDVDVRGWIYSPHKGPLTRKHRLLIGLARRLSGVPAPAAPSPGHSRDSSRHSTHRDKMEDRPSKTEEELVSKEANSILQRGEGEASIAWRGGYSERPGRDSDRSSIYSSRSASPDPHGDPEPGHIPRPVTDTSLKSDRDDISIEKLPKPGSWNQPADMTPAELSTANSHMMTRLKPFLTNPVIGIGITAFFWNDESSQSRSAYTDESGHFRLRATLDFVPTNVRVLASETLSATDEVRITDPTGVSLISDIDDTIKHSGIGSGAKEIFRNTFVRELHDLTIPGVMEWYSKLADLGVQMHYVSNAPWQLYPLLRSYFALSRLPPGSFHLKQYSGMLQGIFEPVAERKKGTIEKIVRDFPERRFILVGDSGEADLEVYTDIVIAYPRRILGVFIRDVTTSERQNFFDKSVEHLNGSRASSRNSSRENLSRKREDEKDARPPLPARRPMDRMQTEPAPTGPTMGTLIDFGDGGVDNEQSHSSQDLNGIHFDLKGHNTRDYSMPKIQRGPPTLPSKPLTLRSSSSGSRLPSRPPSELDSGSRASPTKSAPPPPPPKPRRLSNVNAASQTTTRSPLSQEQKSGSDKDANAEGPTYRSTVGDAVASAYNKLPSPAYYLSGVSQSSQSSQPIANGEERSRSSVKGSDPERQPAPPPPPRRGLSSYPATAAQYASNRLSGNWGGTSDHPSNEYSYGGTAPPVSKKVELWKRRWERAKTILEREGVMLRSWRVGADVMNDAVGLVERASRELERRR